MNPTYNKTPFLIKLAFCCSWAYWFFLLFSSSMVVVHDAAAFEELSRRIHEQGWTSYFTTGPNREPLFPATIALSMRLGECLNLPYQKIQTLLQMLCLGLSQWILWKFLVRFGVGIFLSAGLLLYFGFSPALVNSAFSLFSEILTYPLVLGLLWVMIKLVEKPGWVYTAGFSLLGLALVSVKGIFEIVLVFYAVGTVLLLWAVRHPQAMRVSRWLALGLALLMTGLHGYKMQNLTHNGQYAVTDRGGFMIYGSAYRRVAPLEGHQWQAAVASVAGDGVCLKMFSAEECWYWNFQTTDGFGMKHLAEIGDLPKEQINKKMLNDAWGCFLSNPLAYVGFGFLEFMKMFFWESTKIGFVDYPPLIARIFDSQMFNNLLRLLISALTVLAVFYVVFSSSYWRFLSKDRRVELRIMLMLLVPFLISYSFVSVLTRYSFPMVPVYILLIGLMIQSVMTANRFKFRLDRWDVYFLAVSGAYILWRLRIYFQH